MDAATAQKIVESLDRELARRLEKRGGEEEQGWREESDGDQVVFARHYLDRFLGRIGAKSAEDTAAIVMASVDDDADRAQLERVEHLAEWIVGLAEKVQMLEVRWADVGISEVWPSED
jgi:hypothetical protein